MNIRSVLCTASWISGAVRWSRRCRIRSPPRSHKRRDFMRQNFQSGVYVAYRYEGNPLKPRVDDRFELTRAFGGRARDCLLRDHFVGNEVAKTLFRLEVMRKVVSSTKALYIL